MQVLPLAEAVHHPQLEAREFFHPFENTAQTGLPPFAVPTASYRLSASPAKIHAMAPRHGQHTDDILREHGYTDAEIAQLRAGKVI
jgi:crotonobetainyl-CoA:carnitine CoA-transferase CaiB-like acyl-CoA transferase